MQFPHEHPGYVLRRLEAQNARLNRLAKQIEAVDPADGQALKDALSATALGMAEIARATGSLAQWVVRQR